MMGLFSWLTQDTNESIPCQDNGSRDLITVIMSDNKGNTWTELTYQGYGVFGDKDFFVLMAEMNGITEGTDDEKRDKAIDLYYGENTEGVKYPNLNRHLASKWKNERPKDCPDQGYFYQDDEDDYYWDDSY